MNNGPRSLNIIVWCIAKLRKPLALAMLGLLGLLSVSARPGYALLPHTLDLQQTATALPSTGRMLLGFVLICVLLSLFIGLNSHSLRALVDNPEVRSALGTELLLWTLFSLGVALLPLLVDGILNQSLPGSMFASRDLLIVSTALLGASMGELISLGYHKPIHLNWYIFWLGMGVLLITLASQLYGSTSPDKLAASASISQWAFWIFWFSIVHAAMAKTIGKMTKAVARAAVLSPSAVPPAAPAPVAVADSPVDGEPAAETVPPAAATVLG